MGIRWGNGKWHDKGVTIKRIFDSPAMLAASKAQGKKIKDRGIETMITELKFLDDADDSRAWTDWFETAGLAKPGNVGDLAIADPNVRLQAVIDGQGVALYDSLVKEEIRRGSIYLYDRVKLQDYGYYLVYPTDIDSHSPVAVFRDWIMAEASGSGG